MNTKTRIVLVLTTVLVVGGLLLIGGAVFGRTAWAMQGWTGYGMHGTYTDTMPYGNGMGHMDGYGMMGRAGDMMGGWFGRADVEPLAIDDARAAVEAELDRLGNDDLHIREIMIFDNHAYAIVAEESTGVGAFEVLVDPVTRDVYPEHGPNMMWNLQYGHMGRGMGMMGMMMGAGMPSPQAFLWHGRGPVNTVEPTADMPISAEEAIATAQSYLDAYQPGLQVADEADGFYGYYTIHTERDGETAGMLSVNGYTGQVFLHTWHDDFIEMSDHAD